MTVMMWLAIATLLGGAMWTLPALLRQNFHDPMRLQLCASMTLLGVGNIVSRPSVTEAVDDATTSGVAKSAYNAMILLGLCLMIGFLSERPLTTWRSLRRWEVVLSLTCIVGMIALAVDTPAALRNSSLTSVYLADWHVRGFYNLGNIYLLTGFTTCALLAVRHARLARRSMRLSLGLIAAGLAGLAATCVFRFAWINLVEFREGAHGITYSDDLVCAIVSTMILCAGISMSCLLSVLHMARETNRHRASYRGLEELWSRITHVYPDVVLDSVSTLLRLTPSGYALATYRRYVECQDGLIRLAPHLRRMDHPGDITEETEFAAAIDYALCRMVEATGCDGGFATTNVRRFASGMSESYGDDLDALVRVSAALVTIRAAAKVPAPVA